MKNLFDLLEAAEKSAAAVAVLKRDGHRSRAYWHQVDIELARLKRKGPLYDTKTPMQADLGV